MVFSNIAAEFLENAPDLAGRSVPAVGGDLAGDRDAAGAVAFVGQLFVLNPGQFPGAFHDRPFDVVGWHVGRSGVVDRFAQARVVIKDSASYSGGDGDFPDDPGENFAALGVNDGLFVLDARPMRMSAHNLYPSTAAGS